MSGKDKEDGSPCIIPDLKEVLVAIVVPDELLGGEPGGVHVQTHGSPAHKEDSKKNI